MLRTSHHFSRRHSSVDTWIQLKHDSYVWADVPFNRTKRKEINNNDYKSFAIKLLLHKRQLFGSGCVRVLFRCLFFFALSLSLFIQFYALCSHKVTAKATKMNFNRYLIDTNAPDIVANVTNVNSITITQWRLLAHPKPNYDHVQHVQWSQSFRQTICVHIVCTSKVKMFRVFIFFGDR